MRTKWLVLSYLSLLASSNIVAQSSQLIDAGGHKLEVQVSGSGRPIVVFENGFGNTLSVWREVVSLVEQYATTVTYSRAGYPGSEEGPLPRTNLQLNTELQTILRNLELEPPYLLVGHSLGGLLARSYYSYFPDDVSGMVLVDSAHEHQFLSLLELDSNYDPWEEGYEMIESRTDASENMKGEIRNFLEISKVGTLSNERELENIPLYVLTSGQIIENDPTPMGTADGKRISIDLHSEFMERVTDGGHIITLESDHFIQLSEPGLVDWSIQRVVNSIRNSSR